MFLEDKRSIVGIRQAILKWIQINKKDLNFPEEYPKLFPLEAENKDALIAKLNQDSDDRKTVIFVEKDNSYLGREIVMDFYSQRKQIKVYRMVESDVRLLDEILPKSLDNFKLPFLLHFDNDQFNVIVKYV